MRKPCLMSSMAACNGGDDGDDLLRWMATVVCQRAQQPSSGRAAPLGYLDVHGVHVGRNGLGKVLESRYRSCPRIKSAHQALREYLQPFRLSSLGNACATATIAGVLHFIAQRYDNTDTGARVRTLNRNGIRNTQQRGHIATTNDCGRYCCATIRQYIYPLLSPNRNGIHVRNEGAPCPLPMLSSRDYIQLCRPCSSMDMVSVHVWLARKPLSTF